MRNIPLTLIVVFLSPIYSFAYNLYFPLINKTPPCLFDDFSNPNKSPFLILENSYIKTEYFNNEFRIILKEAGTYGVNSGPLLEELIIVEVDIYWFFDSSGHYGVEILNRYYGDNYI